jgi:hypothetical protein
LWDRLDVMAELLGCRCAEDQHERNVQLGLCFNRQAKCQRTRRKKAADVPYHRSDRGCWTSRDLVTCGHHTCASCGTFRARNAEAAVGCCIERWLGGNEGKHRNDATLDVAMLSMTMPHKATDAVESTVAILYEANAAFFRSRTWEAFATEFGVHARIRFLDATFEGANGAHPHFHIALFFDGAPLGFRFASKRERAAWEPYLEDLRAAWALAVYNAGGVIDDAASFWDFSLKWSPAEEASAYFLKWGLSHETAGTALKSDNHLTLLDKCAAGDDLAGEQYIAFRRAVGGRDWITGMGDTRRIIGVTDADITEFAAARQAKRDEEKPPVLVAPLRVVVRAYLWHRALQVGIPLVLREVERADAAGEDPQRALDRLLWAVAPRSHAPQILRESSA